MAQWSFANILRILAGLINLVVSLPIMPVIESYSYPIRSYHTDVHGRLFTHQLLNFLQDAAHLHADGLGFGHEQLVNDDLLWVLSRLSIDIQRLPLNGQEVEVQTWVKSIRGSISEREFCVKRAGDTIINASSVWVCLSGKTHKPARLPPEYLDLMTTHDLYATLTGAEKAVNETAQSEAINSSEITARYSDTDMVKHVNNAVYMRWALDAFRPDHFGHYQLKGLTINYLNETLLDSTVVIKYWQISNYEFFHEIVDASDNSLICRIKTSWLPIPSP